MFITLLVVTFLISLVVCFTMSRIFANPISKILNRIINDEISTAWVKYLHFAMYVVGISSGVRIHQLERYITAYRKDTEIIVLTMERWVIEVYRTIIGTLSGVAWMLLVFFIFALIAYVLVRMHEFRSGKSIQGDEIKK